MTPLEALARDAFAAAFGPDPTILARAPGRVELLGNHTDYNGGLVLAAAIDRSTVVVASGLLDQFSVLFGRADHALSLDCLSLDYERLPLGHPAPAIVVCDSKTSRRLADGMYNRRREECERVVAYFQARKGLEKVR